MTRAVPTTGRDRSARADRGWFVTAQVLLALLAAVYPQLGARESASSILPPIRIPLETPGPESHAEETTPADGDVDVDLAVAPTPARASWPAAAGPAFGAGRDDEPPATGRLGSAPSRAPPPAS